MIAKTSAFWDLVEKFKNLPVDDPIDELLLFFAWQHLAQKDESQKIPRLDEVIRGQLSLADALLKIIENIEWRSQAFSFSEALEYLSPGEVKKVCQTVTDLRDINRFDLLKTCLRIKSELRKNQALHIFENELLDFLVSLVDAKDGVVFAPYDSNLQISIHCAAKGFKVIYSHANPGAFTELASIIADLKDENSESINDPAYLFGDAELVERDERYSRMILIPPFGAAHNTIRKTINSEVRLIENAISRCTGTLVVLVPQGVLFRGGESSEFRRDLVIGSLLDAVIQLPTPLLRGTNLALAVLVINKDRNRRNHDAVFIDASSENYSVSTGRGIPAVLRNTKQLTDVALRKSSTDSIAAKLVGYGELIENFSELSVSKYVMGVASERIKEFSETLRLEDVALLIRGQLLKEDNADSLFEREFLEVGVRDIGEDGVIQEPGKSVNLYGDMSGRADKQRLYPGDILLVNKGSVGKVGIVASCGDNWVASQSFLIIRAKQQRRISCSSAFLYMYLSSDLVQKYFEENVTGTTIPVLKTGDINGLSIPVLSMEEQKQVEEEYSDIRARWEKIHLLKDEIQGIKSARWSMITDDN